eukprot:CAMPEP_0173387312 /NCGR_PEP_ID=MMETSP1356-20130122/9830_1 /TAXON_ID=77927 ORGANISM="Hemiselmis virescens, Strain PCC157" /NCGR_SAMPLE_ID=MMETSP1356 /ASSEMBLY_ACC=CAM_ASM_000847 /LENGTH=101 /DNA_ID=CAMNT_0014343873 /DNA_START=37 /DNA_END=342 /DNA_ORIENTATION=+
MGPPYMHAATVLLTHETLHNSEWKHARYSSAPPTLKETFLRLVEHLVRLLLAVDRPELGVHPHHVGAHVALTVLGVVGPLGHLEGVGGGVEEGGDLGLLEE